MFFCPGLKAQVELDRTVSSPAFTQRQKSRLALRSPPRNWLPKPTPPKRRSPKGSPLKKTLLLRISFSSSQYRFPKKTFLLKSSSSAPTEIANREGNVATSPQIITNRYTQHTHTYTSIIAFLTITKYDYKVQYVDTHGLLSRVLAFNRWPSRNAFLFVHSRPYSPVTWYYTRSKSKNFRSLEMTPLSLHSFYVTKPNSLQ